MGERRREGKGGRDVGEKERKNRKTRCRKKLILSAATGNRRDREHHSWGLQSTVPSSDHHTFPWDPLSDQSRLCVSPLDLFEGHREETPCSRDPMILSIPIRISHPSLSPSLPPSAALSSPPRSLIFFHRLTRGGQVSSIPVSLRRGLHVDAHWTKILPCQQLG